MNITAATALVGLIGNPVRHSLSPVLHNAWYRVHNVDAAYLAFGATASTFDRVVLGLAAAGAVGVNVTVPFKEMALGLADQASARATACGAANTLTFRHGKIIADNTDGAGFVADLDGRAPGWRQAIGRSVLLGAGGAARGIAAALLGAGVKDLAIVARRHGQAAQLCAELGGGQALDWTDLEQTLQGAVLVINATPRGLKGDDPLSLDLSAMAAGGLVYDTVYVPRQTSLLASAQAAGLTGLDGLGMLVGQGALAFEHWFAVAPDQAAGRALLERALAGEAT